jgi:hypothetical protein
MAAEQCFGITCDSTEISALRIYGVGFGNRKTAVSRKGECAKSGEIRDGGCPYVFRQALGADFGW